MRLLLWHMKIGGTDNNEANKEKGTKDHLKTTGGMVRSGRNLK